VLKSLSREKQEANVTSETKRNLGETEHLHYTSHNINNGFYKSKDRDDPDRRG